jgi:anionic cell wall polymer biosynthesis LytR-Cps2A-Psr (LCP) family protein
MVADQYGNINILILGYGGKGHNGAYLSDSIMVASFDKKLGSVSFLSLPRDMLVIKPNKEVGKLNGYLAQQVAISDTFDQAALATADKIGSMLGMEIYYYAMIDFEGFEKLVDTL